MFRPTLNKYYGMYKVRRMFAFLNNAQYFYIFINSFRSRVGRGMYYIGFTIMFLIFFFITFGKIRTSQRAWYGRYIIKNVKLNTDFNLGKYIILKRRTVFICCCKQLHFNFLSWINISFACSSLFFYIIFGYY